MPLPSLPTPGVTTGWGAALNAYLTALSAEVDGVTPVIAEVATLVSEMAAIGHLGNTPESFNPTAGTGSDDSAAIQACIDAGIPVDLTPGKTYLAHGLVAKPGMIIRGHAGLVYGTSTYTATLRCNSTVDLFTTPTAPGCYSFRFENLVIDGPATSGSLMRGFWSMGSFSNVSWVQNNPAKSAFDINGFVDVLFEGQCTMTHVLNSTVPTFSAVDNSGNLAQVEFGKMRVYRTGNYAFHIEGYSGSIPIEFGFTNVNFEDCNGLIRMLSCRHFKIARCGDWDHSVTPTNHAFYIGKSATAGVAPTGITFEDCIRNGGTGQIAVGGYDVYVDPAAGMAELNLLNCGQQFLGSYLLTAGGSTGTIRGSGVTAINATNMSTDVWQDVSATATLGGSGTAKGNGTLTARMRRSGQTVEYRVKFNLGSTSTIGSQVLVNLPTAESNTGLGVLAIRGLATDTGTASYTLAGALSSTTAAAVYTVGTGGVAASVATTSPFTWGNGDSLEFAITYEAAV